MFAYDFQLSIDGLILYFSAQLNNSDSEYYF